MRAVGGIVHGKYSMIALIIVGIIALILVAVWFSLTARDRAVLFSSPQTFEHDGRLRSYRVAKPKTINEETKLIIGFHGFGDSSFRFAYYTALHNADPEALVVYPEAVTPDKPGLMPGWNAGYCCGSGWKGEVDDAGFIAALIESLIVDYGLNPDNVFVTGFSNGAFMAQRMATDYPDLLRAVSAGSGSIGTTEHSLQPKDPVPILLMHGEQDKIVPFEGGVGASDPDFTWLPFDDTQRTWTEANGDKAITEIQLYPENGHVWNDWRLKRFWHRVPEASRRTVNFFDSQRAT